LSASVDDLSEKLAKIAEFFHEDKQKFNVEELLSRLLQFAESIPALAKVYIHDLNNCAIPFHVNRRMIKGK